MFRIDTATAADALPAPAAAGTPGYFTGGDPIHGVPPTSISPDWLNGIQEELLAILTAAGIAEAKGTNNQVLTALQSLFVSSSGIGQSLTTNGYQVLPGGLIIQWGRNSGGTYSFPIEFPHACFVVVAGNTDSQGSAVDNTFAYPVSTAQFYIATKASNTGSILGFSSAWIAIGY